MFEVIIVGGSYAGISAGMQLARAHRKVLVIDAGNRRNRFAEHSHGFLGQDGRSPAVIVQEAREQLLAYPTVQWMVQSAVSAETLGNGFAITTADGVQHSGRRLILAGGVTDELPAIAGLQERWGEACSIAPIATAMNWVVAPSACLQPRRWPCITP